MNRLHFCPACGLFGRKKRQRDRVAADQALIRFHAHLAVQTRRKQVRRTVEVVPA